MKTVKYFITLFLFSFLVLSLTSCTDELEEQIHEQSEIENLQASGDTSQQQDTGTDGNNNGSKD